jgi:hypothetical protein
MVPVKHFSYYFIKSVRSSYHSFGIKVNSFFSQFPVEYFENCARVFYRRNTIASISFSINGNMPEGDGGQRSNTPATTVMKRSFVMLKFHSVL